MSSDLIGPFVLLYVGTLGMRLNRNCINLVVTRGRGAYHCSEVGHDSSQCVLGSLVLVPGLLGILFREECMCIVHVGEGRATKCITTGGVSVHNPKPNRTPRNKTVS